VPGEAEDYDAIVVGGGPAGSTAAFLLQRSGHNVLLIEKGIHPRPKLCGGLITRKTTRLLERIYGADPGQLIENGIIDYSADSYEIWVKGKRVISDKTKIPFYFVKRDKYDDFLFNRAREADVTIREGDEVVSCDPEGGRLRTASGVEFSGRYVIGADGIHSRVRRSFPPGQIDPNEWKRNRSPFPVMILRFFWISIIRQSLPVISPEDMDGLFPTQTAFCSARQF
jgi:flavin-dependent dehydrogenase